MRGSPVDYEKKKQPTAIGECIGEPQKRRAANRLTGKSSELQLPVPKGGLTPRHGYFPLSSPQDKNDSSRLAEIKKKKKKKNRGWNGEFIGVERRLRLLVGLRKLK